MKKSLVLGIVGLAISSASLLAQSSFEFGNYVGGAFFGAPIAYGNSGVPVGSEGDALGAGFSATAYYSTDSGATWNIVAGSTSPFFGTDGDLGSGAGFFYGGTPVVPVAPGPIQLYVSVANTLPIGTFGIGELTGQSAPFSIITADTSSPTQPNFGSTTYAPFTVGGAVIPEPSTFALAGLGLAGLLIFRRRK